MERKAMNFETTPPRGREQARTEIILKTDECQVALELGLEGKFAAKSTGWDEKPGLPRRGPVGDRSQGRPLGADAPAAKPAAPKPVLHYWPDDE
jgi:hypothetical protein